MKCGNKKHNWVLTLLDSNIKYDNKVFCSLQCLKEYKQMEG